MYSCNHKGFPSQKVQPTTKLNENKVYSVNSKVFTSEESQHENYKYAVESYCFIAFSYENNKNYMRKH